MNTDQLLELRMEIMESERQAQVNRLQRYGSSRTHCAECDEEIPQARQLAVRGVRLCVDCQQIAEMKGVCNG